MAKCSHKFFNLKLELTNVLLGSLIYYIKKNNLYACYLLCINMIIQIQIQHPDSMENDIWKLVESIENTLQKYGIDATACTQRAVCSLVKSSSTNVSRGSGTSTEKIIDGVTRLVCRVVKRKKKGFRGKNVFFLSLSLNHKVYLGYYVWHRAALSKMPSEPDGLLTIAKRNIPDAS